MFSHIFSKNKLILLSFFTIGLMAYLLYTGTIQKATINLSDGISVVFESGNTKEDLFKNIDNLLDGGKISKIVINYLAANHKIYHVTNEDLIDDLYSLCKKKVGGSEEEINKDFSSCLDKYKILRSLRHRAMKL